MSDQLNEQAKQHQKELADSIELATRPPQPTTMTPPQSEEHDRDWCAHSVYRGKNVCTGTIGTPTGDKITCPCKCHFEEPPQSEERPITRKQAIDFAKTHGYMIMPSHPDTLREREIEDAIEGIKDSVKFVGNPSQASGVEIDVLRIRRGILSLVAQEKERWESELRERAGEVLERNELEEFVDFIKSI